MDLSHFEDLVYKPMQVNRKQLQNAIDNVLAEIGEEVVFSADRDNFGPRAAMSQHLRLSKQLLRSMKKIL